MSTPQPGPTPVDPVEATDYEIAVDVPGGEMMILFKNNIGVLSTHVMSSHEAYTFAHRMLRGYDRIEGL
jgi:hypothetical protein